MRRANDRRITAGHARLFSAALVCAVSTLWAQQPSSPQISAADLVRQTVANEVAANDSDHKHMFRSRRLTPKGSQTRLYVETTEAMAGMLIAVNDRPLTSQQQQAEKNHLAWLMNNPDQLRKKRAREKEDADRTMRIVRALPEAFLFEYTGTENGVEGLGKPGDELLRLNFKPNPSYEPPSRVEQVLEGMQGHLLIDAPARRIAQIDGTLFRDVSFGWGFIGHLDKGGRFFVQQADVGDGSWELTRMILKITGRILLFKSIGMNSDESFSDFHEVPKDLSFAKGVELLQTEFEKPSHDGPHSPPVVSKDASR